MGKQYTVESDFDDLHGNPAEAVDLDIDLSDTDNPIIQAALNGDEDYQPPEDDKDKDGDQDDTPFDDDDEDDDTLEEMDAGDDKTDNDDDDDEDDDSDSDEDDDEDGDEDDDDKKSYSKNVQKRIDRERDARRVDNDASNKRIAKLERRITLSDAKETFRDEQADADKKLAALRKKKTAALDEEDNESVVDIDEQMLDIKADRKAKEIGLKQLKDSIDDEPEDSETSNTPPAGITWLKKYPQFHTNRQFKAVVLQADRMVQARNFDRETEEYYVEIEKILAPQFPEIVKIAKKTTRRKKTRETARKKKRSAVGSTTKAGTRTGSRRRGQIRLTKADQQQMEIFGMNPKDPADIKAWAESKGRS